VQGLRAKLFLRAARALLAVRVAAGKKPVGRTALLAWCRFAYPLPVEGEGKLNDRLGAPRCRQATRGASCGAPRILCALLLAAAASLLPRRPLAIA